MQPTFSIRDAAEPFKRDLKRSFDRTSTTLANHLETGEEQLQVLAREGHMLKGLCSMVQAHALSRWGDLLERMSLWSIQQPMETQNHVIRVMRQSLAAWQGLINLTVEYRLKEAEEFFEKVHDWFFRCCPEAGDVFTTTSAAPEIHLDLSQLKRVNTASKPAVSSLPGLITHRTAQSAPIVQIEAGKSNGNGKAVEGSEQTVSTPKPVLRMPGLKTPGLNANGAKAFTADLEPQTDFVEPEYRTEEVKTLVPAFIEWFVIDAEEIVVTLEQSALAWEKGDSPDKATQSILRGLHTLKGSANSVDLLALGSDLHRLEDWLEANIDKKSKKVLGGFFVEIVDHLKTYLKALKVGKTEWTCPWNLDALDGSDDMVIESKTTPAADGPQETTEAPEDALIRIPAESLRTLSTEVGELLINRNRLEARFAELTSLQDQLSQGHLRLQSIVSSFQDEFEFTLRKEGKTASTDFTDLEFDRYDQFNLLTRRIVEAVADDKVRLNLMQDRFRVLDTDLHTFSTEARKIQGHLIDLSVVPFESLVPRLERAFRDALKTYPDRQAELVIIGGSTPIDKDVSDRLFNPLLHLIRNAVAHGIETPEMRTQLGKNPMGTVELRVDQLGSEISITVEDNGRGLDLEKIRVRAIEKGLLGPEVASIDRDTAMGLVFLPRFSTADTVTNVSGRGIGMDVVKTEMKACSGGIFLQDTIVGTRWVLKLPSRMNLGEAVFLRIGHQTCALPLAYFKRGVLFDPEQIDRDQRGDIYYLEEHAVPLVYLHKILGSAEETIRGVVIEVDGKEIVITCNQIINNFEIVIKELPPLLRSHPFIAATTLDSRGAVVPILDPSNIVRLWQKLNDLADGKGTNSGIVRNEQKHVLIVDDSLSVRKAQERILEEIGTYTIDSAVHGVDALEMMRNRKPDVVFTDLEMPIMDGYELISEIRSHEAWRDIPIIVISSRSAEKYINKAMNLQANTFISKPFTKEQILDILAEHVTAVAA